MAHKITPKTITNRSIVNPLLGNGGGGLGPPPQFGTPINNAGREFGRISGPLLSANLLRNGHDLAFETSLLYLNVTSGYVGIKNSTPVRALDMLGDTTTDNLIVDTETDIGIGFQITTNQIYNNSIIDQTIVLQPNQSSTPTINISGGLKTNNLTFATNVLTGTTNTNIYFTPYQNPNYVTNAGFETGDTTGWTITGDVGKITVVGVDNAISGSYALSAASYIQTSTVKQRLSTDPGQTYVITFNLKNIVNVYLAVEPSLSVMTTEDSLNVIALTPNSTTGQADFKVLWNGVVLTGGTSSGPGPSVPYSSPNSSFWEYTTYTFTATSIGSDELSFSLRNDYSIFYIDKISVILQGTTGGITQINSNTLVNGLLHATGDITFDGDIVFGDSVNDRITIPAEVSSDIIPLESTVTITPTTVALTDQLGNALTTQTSVGLFTNPGAPYQQTNSWNLGSSTLQWNNVWLNSATLYTSLTSNTVTTAILNTGNISISANSISNTTADLSLTTLGVGQVKINGAVLFDRNTINNPSFSNPYFTTETGSFIITTETGALVIAAEVTALPFTIANTGAGVTKFSGTKAVRLPAGTTAVRPTNPQTGTTRYNTSNQNTEIYNGTSWQDIAGVSTTTSAENDLTTIWSLILG